MAGWLRTLLSHSRRTTVFRPDHLLSKGDGRILTSTIINVAVGETCKTCGSSLTRLKRMLPVALRYARRYLTTPTKPPSRYLLFGVAGFMWERERISNEEVMRCLRQYEERVKSQGSPNSSLKQRQSSQPSLQNTQEGEIVTNSLLTPNSWSLSSIWSAITFGWFGTSNDELSDNDKSHMMDSSRSVTGDGGLKLTSGADLLESSQAKKSERDKTVDNNRQRRAQFAEKLGDYLKSHSEQRLSQLPLVGLCPKGPLGFSFGAKLVKKATNLKYRVLSMMAEASVPEVNGQEGCQTEEMKQGNCYRSKIADLACLGIQLHDHICVAEAEKEGDWCQFKIFEFGRDFSEHESDLGYRCYYPTIGLQDHNAPNRITSLIQGSSLATILQSIEQLSLTYDHVLGTDYHLDASLFAHSQVIKTRVKHFLSQIVGKITNQLKQFETDSVTNSNSSDDGVIHETRSLSTTDHSAPLLRGGAQAVREGVASTASGPVGSRVQVQVQGEVREALTQNGGRFEGVSDRQKDATGALVNSFHHFSDVHLASDDLEGGPPVSRQLGQELLTMLRMARSKVRLERQQTGHGSSTSRSSSPAAVNTGTAHREDGVKRVEATESSEKQAATSLEGWELLATEKSAVVYRRLYQDTGLYQYKVIGRYHDITAKDYLEVQVDHTTRKTWDTHVITLETVDTDPKSGSELIYWVMKYPFPMSNRDYVFVRNVWISPKEDAIVSISRSIEHPDLPVSKKFTRVHPYFSDVVIKPHSFIDEPGFDYELTYLDNPQVSLPSSIVNWVTTTAMPDFLTKIHQAAATRQRNQANNLLHNS